MLKFKLITIELIRKVLITMIKIYQLCIAPYLSNNCRFVPTCSEYSKEVTKKYGILEAISLTFKRILRCNPFGGKGYEAP